MTAIVQDSESRARVVQAATALFVRDGYKATSMKAIATQLGISPPALYWHFPSKQDLFLASMEALLDTFVDYVAGQVTADQPRERLREFVIAHVTWKLEQRDEAGAYTTSLGMRDIVHELPEEHQEALIVPQRRHLDLLRGILREGSKAGQFNVQNVRVTAFAIITMCEYVVSWFDPAGEFSPRQIADVYANLAEAMVTNSGPSAGRSARPTPARKAPSKAK